MKALRTATALAGSLCLIACAKHTNEIQPQYVSPMQYGSYSCKQIEREMRLVSSRVSEVGATVEDTASSDDTEMGVGLILFWPTLFFLDGDTPQANEYARLRGEFNALEEAGIQKNCGLHVERPIIPQRKQQESKPVMGPDAGRR